MKICQEIIAIFFAIKFKKGCLMDIVFYVAIMLALLIFEVISQLLFIYYASWLGQSVVRDIRIKLFKQILGFKMKIQINFDVF